MGYKPKTPEYERAVRGIVGIFEAGEADEIEISKRVEAADLLGQVGDPRLKQDNWVTIPAGTFLMGAQKENEREPNYDPEAYDDESPVHKVSLRAFRIQRYPVTVQEFGEFLADGGDAEPEDWERQKQFPNRAGRRCHLVRGRRLLLLEGRPAAVRSGVGARGQGAARLPLSVGRRAARSFTRQPLPWGGAPNAGGPVP